MTKEDFTKVAINKKFPSGFHYVVYEDKGYIETFIIGEKYTDLWRLDCSAIVSVIEYRKRFVLAKVSKTTMWVRNKK